MKTKLRYILLSLIPFAAPLYADLDDEANIEAEWLQIEGDEEGNSPFTVKADFDVTGKADFKRKRRGHVSFAEANIDGTMIFYYDPCFKEVMFATAGYEYTRIDWNKNPYFHQKNFNTLTLGVGAASKRLNDWLWQALIKANFDLTHFKFSEYITYDLLAWGRYTYCQDINLHLGFLAFTGMKFDRVYPIVGVDWRINENWRLNAIFPINMSLQYFFSPQWSVSLAAKAFQSRHRAGPHEHLPRAIVIYTAGGIELDVDYVSVNEKITFNAHVGEILGGRLKIANMHYHHKHRHRFRTAPYVGGEVSYKF